MTPGKLKFMKTVPPSRPLRFLRWFCRPEYLEEIEGDLTELFLKQHATSPKLARRRFMWSVIKHFRPEFIRSPRLRTTNPTNMLRHNVLITYRNAWRYKSAFFINLTGLSAGLAAAILIFLWVADEFATDKFHEKDARLYQVFEDTPGGAVEPTPGLLAETLADEIPEVEYAASVIPSYWFSDIGIASVGDNRFKVAPQFVGRDFFNIFTCPLVDGDKNNVLADKHNVIISETLAQRLFKTTTGVIGKPVQWSHGGTTSEFFVSGVFQDVPANASLKFDILFNYSLFLDQYPHLQVWTNSDPNTYVVLRKGATLDNFNGKIANLKQRKTGQKENSTYVARRYSDNYLYGSWQLGNNAGLHQGRIQYVSLFVIVGAFIVIIACINFMNLATARASRRMKEIGIKKAVGAGRGTLIGQYLGEAMLTTVVAAMLAFSIVWLLLPAFNDITAKQLTLTFTPRLVLPLMGIVVFTGLIAGSYPALYLSRFNPVTVLKGRLITSWGEQWARKGLVIVQFTASVVLIVSVLVVYRQITFIQSKNLGYNRENVVYFEPEWKGTGGQQAILDEVKKIPGVINASSFYHDLLGHHGSFSGIEWDGKDPNLDIGYSNLEVGYDFIETLGIKLVAGKTFTRDIDNEKQIIINEEAVRQMGLKDPVGKIVKFWGQEREIVGVAQTFNFQSLYSPITPCLFRVYPELPNTVVRIQAGSEQTTIPQLEKIFHRFNPGLAFDCKFLDNSYQALYASEQRIGTLAKYFAGIAIIISCLGLFGLAAFTAERRVKEIGIRKILGATDTGIIRLLSAEFSGMVLIAVAIGLPVSYLATQSWLGSFAYRMDVPVWLFIMAGGLTFVIAWLTVAAQTIKAARTNPAQTLKTE